MDAMTYNYKGHIQLSVYINSGLLTAHVIGAGHLTSRWKEACDSYVKLCLSPDKQGRTQCKTEIIPNDNNPYYNRKFSFELLPVDITKRLLVSVWHNDCNRNNNEFLGCTSFGIKSLLENFRYVLRRGADGLGLTVTGACPVRVCKVDVGSSACRAGLREGDYVTGVDNINVSRSSVTSVAKLIRRAGRSVQLQIQRPDGQPRSASDHPAESSSAGSLSPARDDHVQLQRAWKDIKAPVPSGTVPLICKRVPDSDATHDSKPTLPTSAASTKDKTGKKTTRNLRSCFPTSKVQTSPVDGYKRNGMDCDMPRRLPFFPIANVLDNGVVLASPQSSPESVPSQPDSAYGGSQETAHMHTDVRPMSAVDNCASTPVTHLPPGRFLSRYRQCRSEELLERSSDNILNETMGRKRVTFRNY